MRTRVSTMGTIALLLLLGGCAPPSSPPAGGPGSGPPPPEQPRARKHLTIAIQREPSSFQTSITGAASPTAGGASNVEHIVHDSLTVETGIEQYEPQLALEKPSLEKGTWRIHTDGTMETTWNLRPNIKWHDGAPFTSNDLVFSFTVQKDPDLPKPRSPALGLIHATSAADPQQFVIHWSSPYVEADHEGVGTIIPKHLLGDLYHGDKPNFVNRDRKSVV